MNAAWKPSCSLFMLKARAQLYATIRQFFSQRGVMEVDTPALSRAGACDLNIASLQTDIQGPGGLANQAMYLQTSPEFAMKRLLAAGCGPVYQIAHAFRNAESGRYHNPEFTLLEWYQPRYSLHQLMEEMRELLGECLGQLPPVLCICYGDLFQKSLGVNPHGLTVQELNTLADDQGLADAARICGAEPSDWLDYLFSECIQPRMRAGILYFVHDYPADQAMLARIRPSDPPVAERFEVYLNGVELANGFHELADAGEQQTRFESERLKRQSRGLPAMPLPEHLLQALSHGLPDCCGVALGLDRLLMLATESDHIDQVLAFPAARA